MKKLTVEDKAQIKQLLYCNSVLAVKDGQYSSFNGFQLWWYDRERDTCYCCESHWSDVRKQVKKLSLDKAAKTLWRKRNSLFMQRKHLFEDRKLASLRCSRNSADQANRRPAWMGSVFTGRPILCDPQLQKVRTG